MGLSLSTKIRSPSEPESNRTSTNFLLIVLVSGLAVVTMLRSTPHHNNYGGGSALRWVFGRCNTIFLSSLPFWLDDVILMSPALLTDAVLTSSELLAMLVGVAFIGLGGV
jgi:hypothetical protein